MSSPLIVLASGSATRRKMLEDAGVSFEIVRPDVDEGALKAQCRSRGLSAAETAEALALAKAKHVSASRPGDLVVGADQMLECGDEWFDKPQDRKAAVRHLQKLSGRTHRLHSAVVAARGDRVVWSTVDVAELTVRPLSEAFLSHYLEREGEAILSSVGAYRLESLGVQLFSAIHGNHFTILGMPLLPLLAFLREEGLIPS